MDLYEHFTSQRLMKLALSIVHIFRDRWNVLYITK